MFLTIVAVFLIIFGVIYGSKSFTNHTSIGMSSFMFAIAMFFRWPHHPITSISLKKLIDNYG